VEGLKMVKSDYRGYQIEVVACRVKDAWDADVRIRRTSSKASACAGRLTCRKPTAQVAEERGAVCARDWIDRHGRAG
jgi:hypothetical protein